MAAGQPKKRSNSASVMRFNLHEQRRLMKKRKYESSDCVLNMSSHVSLEWDDCQRRAVAKREQVGITWRDMAPFVDSIPRPRSDLADVFSVPEEIFGLESINEVLSYEVWETYLSETERKFLIQFLPCGIDSDKVLQPLLMGQNIHFGSPFFKWGASLCAGNVHPDAVLSRNQQLKADKKNYYSVLKQYHTEIIENLLKWKERWTSCKNPEKDIVENMWRNGITDPDYGSLRIISERANVLNSKEEKSLKVWIHEGAPMKYMSYIKVSRKQLELVKDIKHSGDGIQSKSLKCVLGDIKDFCIHPYETFEEDEGKRLHDHWVQLATKDIPCSFEDRRERRSLRDLWGKSLEQELAEKPIMEKDGEKENPESSLIEGVHNGELEHPCICDLQDQGIIDSGPHSNDSHQRDKTSPPYNMQDQEELDSDEPNSTDSHRLEMIHSLNNHAQYQEDVDSALNPSDCHSHQEFSHNVPDQGGNYDISKPADTYPVLSRFLGPMNVASDVMKSKASQPSGGHHLERVPPCNSPPGLRPTILGQKGNQYIEKQAVLPQFLGNVNPTRDLLEPKASMSSLKDIWPAAHIQSSYFHSTSETHGYESAGELSLGQPQPVEEHPTHFTDMQTDVLDRRIAKTVASALDMDTQASMFSSYAIRDRDVLLPPFPKGQGMLPSYSQGHLLGLKHPGLQFMAANDTSQFANQFLGQQQGLLEQRQAREREIYMHQMMSKNMNSNDRYPCEGHLSSVDSQDWSAIQSPVNGGLLSHNWLLGEYRACNNGWTNVETSGTVNGDESLFSVLSECKKSPPHLQYDTMNSTQFAHTGNFVGGDVPNSYGVPACAHHHQLNNGGSGDVAMKMSNGSWANAPHQNSGLNDPVGRTFLRSWNH